MFDVYNIEYNVVRFRNWIHCKIEPKDSPESRKIFVVGYPRTATKTLHNTFELNGLKSRHHSGRWFTKKYDCFSDRGNYQPLGSLRKDYPQAFFLLNTRPARHYIYSRLKRYVEISMCFSRPRPTFSRRYIKGQIIQRNRYFVRFAWIFLEAESFLVLNIEKPGAFEVLKEALEFEYVPEYHEGTSKKVLTQAEKDLADSCFEELGVLDEADHPFVIRKLLSDKDRKLIDTFTARHGSRVHL